ncbi:MAG: hypothetical protein EOO51_08170 [Flavobacterium sp.]|nr:MAG: hypothetical protein EOO51_08170 [Flavobacterium sp.]
MSEENYTKREKVIRSHHSPEDIHKHFMFDDIRRWKQEIELVNVEMIFFRNLIESHRRETNSWSSSDYQNLFNSIKDVEHYNQTCQRNLQAFNAKVVGLNECIDLQCEHHYLNDHSQLRLQLERHFSTYKSFKKTILSYLKTRYNY